MNLWHRFAASLVAVASLVLAIVVFTPGVAGQDGAWLVVRADYGFRAQRTDVTTLVRNLLSHGGVNGRIAVNNQTMGGDPALGRDKSLRIFAKDARNQDHEFDYNEGGFVPVSMFVIRGDDRDGRAGHDDHDRNDGPRDRDDSRSLTIVRGFYGAQGRMVSVTDLLQRMTRNGSLTVNASNGAMGIDPAPGADKILIVVYQYRGKEQAAAASEGHSLSIP